MRFKQEQSFTGTEISEYLQSIPVAELVSYDLRIPELIQRIKNDVLRFIPKERQTEFSQNFINYHFGKRRMKNDKRHFEKAMFKTLHDEIMAAKKLLYDTAQDYPIFLGEGIPSRFAADEINQAYYNEMHQHNTIVAVGVQEAKRIMMRLYKHDPQRFQCYTDDDNSVKNTLLAITPENINIILDCIGYTIKPKNRQFKDLHKKLNRLRLALSDADHQTIFGKAKNAGQPYTINPEHAHALWGKTKNVLTHSQILSIWYALENDTPTREKLFEAGNLASDQPIKLIGQKQLYLQLLNAAAKCHHNTQLVPSQCKELLSHLTLQQLLALDKLRYNKGADASRNVLTSGSQYLGAYSVNTGNIAPVLNILMGAALNFSMYAAAVASLAFGAVVLGGAAAYQQYLDNKYKEQRFRLTHIIKSLAINRKHQETIATLDELERNSISSTSRGKSRYDQLINIITEAGLAEELQKGLKESREISPIKHAFKPHDVQLNQLYQLSSLMHYLQNKETRLNAYYETLASKQRRDGQTDAKKAKIGCKMIQTENLLQFIKLTLVDAPCSAAIDNPVILAPKKASSLSARVDHSMLQMGNKIKRYYNSKENALRPVTNAIVTTIVVTLSLTAAALLFTSGIGIGIAIAIAAASLVIGICCAAGSYVSVKEDQLMHEIDDNNCKQLRKEEQHSEQIDSFTKAATALKQIESIEHRSYSIHPNSPEPKKLQLTVEQQLRAEKAENMRLRQKIAALEAKEKQQTAKQPTHLTQFSFMKSGGNLAPLAERRDQNSQIKVY